MIAYFSNWLILFPVAFSLFLALRLSQASVDQGKSSWTMISIRGMITLMFVFSLLAVGLRPSPLSLFWFFLLIFFGVAMFLKNRRLERMALLLTGIEETDLTRQHALVGFFFQENSGRLRRQAKHLGYDLAAGVPWWSALEKRGIARSIYERLAIRLRSKHGETEARAHGEGSSSLFAPLQIEAEAERLLGRLMIFSWVMFVPLLTALIFTFILPTFREMFEEFGLQFPGVTQRLLEFSSLSSRYGLEYLLAGLSLVLMIVGFLLVLLWLAPSLMQLPALRWFCRDYHMNAGFIVLASLLDRGHDILSACRETVGIIPVPYVAHRFHAVVSLMEQGMSPSKAFVSARLLSTRELKACGLALESSESTWGLRELAGWKSERMLARYSIVVQFLVILITLLLALIVGLVAIGLIAALATMITALS